jgi:hypothetical protein
MSREILCFQPAISPALIPPDFFRPSANPALKQTVRFSMSPRFSLRTMLLGKTGLSDANFCCHGKMPVLVFGEVFAQHFENSGEAWLSGDEA